MTALLKYFVELCLLRKGPQDAPVSQSLLILTGTALVATAVITDQLHEDMLGKLSFAVIQVAMLTAVVWAILSIARHGERVMQTLIAMYGSGALIQLLMWPFRARLDPTIEDPEQLQAEQLPLIAVLIFGIWSFIIMIHIYRNALDTTRGKAILITILTQIIIGLVMLNLFGGARA